MNLCLAGEHCRQRHPTTKQPATLTDNQRLCDTDLNASTAAVHHLVRDYRDLEQLLAPPLGVWSDGQPRSTVAPAPIRLHPEALQRAIWHLTTTWAEILTDHHHLTDPPSPVRQGYAVQWAVGVITPRVDVLVGLGGQLVANYAPADPDEVTVYGTRRPAILGHYPRTVRLAYVTGARGLLDLAELHRRATVALGLTSPVRQLPGHCLAKGCGRAELRQAEPTRAGDEPLVFCGHCGNGITRDDYERYANLFLRPKDAVAAA